MRLVLEKTLSNWMVTNPRGTACYKDILHHLLSLAIGHCRHWIPGNFRLHILSLWKIDVMPLRLYETQTYRAQKQPPLQPLLLHLLQNQRLPGKYQPKNSEKLWVWLWFYQLKDSRTWILSGENPNRWSKLVWPSSTRWSRSTSITSWSRSSSPAQSTRSQALLP